MGICSSLHRMRVSRHCVRNGGRDRPSGVPGDCTASRRWGLAAAAKRPIMAVDLARCAAGCEREAITVKLLWFHLMPYTELPADFRDKHPSVWVDIHSSLFDPKRAHLMYNDFMDELEYAADLGYDAICVNEHHSNGYGLIPSPNLIASSLARRTSNAAICIMGNSLALYTPPTRVAEEMAMIDCISGGRLIAGFPVGT